MSGIRFLKIHRSWEDWLGMLIGVLIGISPWLAEQQVDQAVMWNAVLVGALVLGLAQLEYVSLQRWAEAGEIKEVAIGPHHVAKAKSVIFLFMCGGVSHIDTFDPKPNAPAEVRGPFNPIPTAVPGTQLSEILPKTAKLARRTGSWRASRRSIAAT